MKNKTNKEKIQLLKNFLRSLGAKNVTLKFDPDEKRELIKFTIDAEL